VYRIVKTALAAQVSLVFIGGAAFVALWNLVLCYRPVDLLSSGVVAWWTALCFAGVVNVCGWHRTAAALARRRSSGEGPTDRLQRWQLLLSAVFVLGCGFRSVLPRADVQRLGLIDSWMSSVVVGRSVATVAELCFVAQWALLLNHAARQGGSRLGVIISRLLVPLIAVAEVCSWYAILTTCYAGNAIEESIWALSATLLIVACLALWSGCRAARRPFLAAALVLGVAYVTFMCTVDVPMYVSRWQADEASGRPYLSLSQGLQDAWSRRVVTFSWEEWRTEVPWMTLYFTVAVWWSLALVHVPRWLQDRKQSQGRRLLAEARLSACAAEMTA
jgi:hypothetical protein